MPPRNPRLAEPEPPDFDVAVLVRSAGGRRQVTAYDRGAVIFSQGEPSHDIRYIQEGAVTLSVLSSTGREAVIAMLAEGEFFGEGALAGQSVRIETATAAAACRVLSISVDDLTRLIHEDQAFSDRFIAYLLSRTMRVEADLVDQLFNSSEKRLARALLLLSRYGHGHPDRRLPQVSQETLAEMVGTTRSRVNFFMNKFRKLGLIEYGKDGLKVSPSLMSVVLHD